MTQKLIRLPDGSSWPRPSLESDEYHGVGWLLIYGPDQMTRADQLFAASIIFSYGTLVTEPSAAKKLPALRRALREELEEREDDDV